MQYLKSIFAILFFTVTLTSCAQQDNIIGVWEVKNEYYQGVYEIVEYEGKFFGKVHYYNDGKEEYKGNNKKEDYFLTDVEANDGSYINGKMYLPDSSYYEVIFNLKDENTLEVKMTVQGQPYSEIWNKNTSYK